ncbi:chitinase [Chitinophaga parva]|uniref:chitinase n=1 Tax=Chitinophaga parva TaxID=2169414 RepID=A0A2T7BH97_9BACT|nr:glycoside hydrolase family 18 protein [Chitinophaga parva]PUZ25654.1 chitinase [Chitinophaga parva]
MFIHHTQALLLLLCLGGAGLTTPVSARAQPPYKVIAYVGAFGHLLNVQAIDAKKLTHINYAFVNCKDSLCYLDHPQNDTTNFHQLNGLKQLNPSLKILISIGGGTRSRFLSDAVLTPTSRHKFVASAVGLVQHFDLDGVDVDWEYPGQAGNNNNTFRPVEDKPNFTRMWAEFRRQLDSLGRITHKHYLLSGAFNVSKAYTDHVDLAAVARYMDYINLMTYDFSGPQHTVGHHTNLYGYGTLSPRSADKGIRDYIAQGVPPGKLLIGVAFYAHGMKAATTAHHGLGEKVDTLSTGEKIPAGGFTQLKDSVINQHGYTRYWDSAAHAPYLFNDSTRYFITYDDEASTREKAVYVQQHHLGGAFFWEYFNDPKTYLLPVLHAQLGQ